MFASKLNSYFAAALLSLVAATSAQAGRTVYVEVGGSAYLGDGSPQSSDCGGTIEVNNGGNNNQLNIVLRNVEACGSYSDSLGNEHKINLGETNAFTLAVAKNLPAGRQQMVIDLHSGKRNHQNKIIIGFTVTSSKSASQIELEQRGTMNRYPVIAYFGGQSQSDFNARMDSMCKAVGASRAINYSVKQAAYDGQQAVEYKNGAWAYRTIKSASQAAVFTSLKCSN